MVSAREGLARELAYKRRYAIVGAFVLAAIATPPDVWSQLSLALPLLALYEAVIVAVRWSENRR
jgi:sec-independent protein translocase protein TatC